MTDRFAVSIFPDKNAFDLRLEKLNLAELGEMVMTTNADAKHDLPLIKLASFGDARSEKNSLRHNANVKSISGVEGDYDAKKVSFEEAVRRVRDARLKALLYTSPSYTVAEPKWRVILPASRDLPSSDREQMTARLNGVLGGILANESFTLSQAYYYGRVNGNPAPLIEIVDGEFIDLRNDLDAGARGKEIKEKSRGRTEPPRDDLPPILSLDDRRLTTTAPDVMEIIKTGKLPSDMQAGHAHFKVVAELVRGGLSDVNIKQVYWLSPLGGYVNQSSRGFDGYLEKTIEAARVEPLILPDADHMKRARITRANKYPFLVHYRDDFMDFDRGAYRIIEDGEITANTWSFLDGAKAMRKESRARDAEIKCVPFHPNRISVAETIAALKSVSHLAPSVELPCWLDGRSGPRPSDLIAFPNGLLDVSSRVLHPLDPNFLTLASLGFDYDANAADPVEWIKFLDQIFAGDEREQQVGLLQEIFGYALTSDVSQEKAFLLLGPKRSGKGTIAAVLRRMLSSVAVVGPSLKSLGNNFGLTPLIGRQLAIIDDLRIGSPKDQETLIENLLKITGRGLFTIDRKFKSSWTGSLLVKLILISNPMPKLGDDSAALASRFIILSTRVSFYGREDPNLLERKLMPELPGIFLWSMEGLKRLRQRGHFEETEESNDARERFANLGSPAKTFIAEYCRLDPNAHVEKQTLYENWKSYATQNNIYPGNLEKFCEAIYAATGGAVRGGRSQRRGERINVCFGIELRDHRAQSRADATTNTDIPL
jgi:putative DNA primase/helicase